MKNNIETLIRRTDCMLEQDNISLEISGKLAEETAEILVSGDTAEWRQQYHNSDIKPL